MFWRQVHSFSARPADCATGVLPVRTGGTPMPRGKASLRHTAVTFSRRYQIVRDLGKELLAVEGLSLPQGAFVIHMHQGYQFFFLAPDGVYYFHEGWGRYDKEFPSFAEFFKATAGKM